MISKPSIGMRVLLKGKTFDPNNLIFGYIIDVIPKCDPYVDVTLDLGFRYLAHKEILEDVDVETK